MSSDVIIFKNVTKKYSKYDGVLKARNFLDRIKNGQFGKKLVKEEDFFALKDVSFRLKKGERLGIIGPNGAGKSTTLKLISKIAFPTSGSVKVQGTVGGLIELGAGFQNDLTGRENVYLSTAIQGLSKRETDHIFDRIVEISELEHFIDVPIKKYSSGMKVRLGFAAAIMTVPDIILMDEVLAVGDAKFKQKSLALLEDYLEGRTLVFVSHSMAQVKKVCDRVILLNKGNPIFDGAPEEAISAYDALMEEKNILEKQIVVQRNTKRGFAQEPLVKVKSFQFHQPTSSGKHVFSSNQKISFKFDLAYKDKAISNTSVKVKIKRVNTTGLLETISGIEINLTKEQLTRSNQVNIEFDAHSMYSGQYLVEITPDVAGTSSKTAVVICREEFQIEAQDKDITYYGLANLNIEPIFERS